MKRIAVFAVLAIMLVVGVVMFIQQSEQSSRPEAAVEEALKDDWQHRLASVLIQLGIV